MNSDYRDHTS